MTDLMELFRHWHAGRSQVQISTALGIDRKTIRKYLAPALTAGLTPGEGGNLDEALWWELIAGWFSEVGDPAARAVTWPAIAAHHDWIDAQLTASVTVAQRLRVRDSYFKGREFTSLAQMQDAALTWCTDVYGRHNHRGLDGAHRACSPQQGASLRR